MLHKGVVAFALMAALGLAVALFSLTWLSSPGTGTRPVAAAMPDEGPGDAINCQTEQPVVDAALDIVAVSLDPKPGGYEVFVRTAGSPAGVFDNAYSAAVVVTLGNLTENQTRLAEKHAGTDRQGLLDAEGEVIDGTEDSVSIGADGVRFNFPGPLKEDASLLVETFHQKAIFDDVTCDTAFSNDPTAPKPTPTPTVTPEPATATPTPTDAPEFFKVTVRKIDDDTDETLSGWVMRYFVGDGCQGSPFISLQTSPGIRGETSDISIDILPGDYSLAEVQQPGWERIGAFCQNFTVVEGGKPTVIEFRNRRLPTATPEPATDTPTPTDAPEPPTATPTPTPFPEFFKVFVRKINADTGAQLDGWEMKIFDGDGCFGSPRVSGVTLQRDPSGTVANYSILLLPGSYSLAETQQPGWERVGGPFCQDFTITASQIFPPRTELEFKNRVTRDGDVTGDGSTDSRDASVVLQFTAGLTIQEEIAEFFRGDVNLDETTDSRDATLILQFGAGFLDSLPVGGS